MLNAFIFVTSTLLFNHATFAKAGKTISPTPKLSTSEILAASTADEWRPITPENTLYMTLTTGRVIIELAPTFAPKHVENLKSLAAEKYWDGLAITRSQDNYVAQWADPNSENAALKRTIKSAKAKLNAEFERTWDPKIKFVKHIDGDVYAPEVGFIDDFPVARDLKNKKIWLLHCYGTVGSGRDVAPDSGGLELYAVTGHSPRHLDRNVTLVGRVVQGMELLSTLPRGKGPMGFYDKPELNVPIQSIRLANDLPAKERVDLEVLRTDSSSFKALINSRRYRPEDWFIHHPNKIEICNVPIPVRIRTSK